jgi:SAM-dependent methyltransferase
METCRIAMDRFSKITGCLDLSHEVGLEIGPLCWPVVTKAHGRIFYSDHLSTDELRKKYASDKNVDHDRIVSVDFVTGSRSLLETVGHGQSFDYVIASHVIEHVPDPITFLQELTSLIRVGGHICLVIPDRRYTFDYYRPVSQFSELVEAHLLKRTKPSPGQVFNFFSRKAIVNAEEAWAGRYDAEPPMIESPLGHALDWAKEAARGDRYLDVHCFVYTPRSFVEVLKCCFELGFIDLRVARFWDTDINQNEFIIILERLQHFDDPQLKKDAQISSLPGIEDAAGAGLMSEGPPDWTLVGSNSGSFEGRIFVVWKGRRFWVPTVEWATDVGFRWPDDIHWISDDELGLIPYSPGLPSGKPEFARQP